MPGARWSLPDVRAAGWSQVVAAIGTPDCAALKDLMARMGDDSERAAMIYQHEARGG